MTTRSSLPRLLAARALLWLAHAADGALELLAPNALRGLLARLATKAARRLLDLSEWLAPWIRSDYVPPAPDASPPTLREMAIVLGRAKLLRWKLALARITS